jgi:hypothetical protein
MTKTKVIDHKKILNIAFDLKIIYGPKIQSEDLTFQNSN